MMDATPLTMPWSDAVVAHALGAALSVILLVGAWSKLRDGALFRASLEGYQLLPAALLPVATWVLPLWELACGLAVLVRPGAHATLLATGGLLLTVSAAMAINLLRGRRDIDCGCAGLSGPSRNLGEQTIGWPLVARNGLLLVALLLATGGRSERLLVWVDYLSVSGATLALLGLYVAGNQLITNQPRLQAIKRS